MDSGDLEDPSPVNPFRYWRERIRDEDTPSTDERAQKLGSELRDVAASSVHGAGSTIQPRREPTAPRTGESCPTTSSTHVVSKRRTPPPRPVGHLPNFSSIQEQGGPVPKGQQDAAVAPQAQHASLGLSGGLQERIDKLEAAKENSSDAESYVPRMKQKLQTQAPTGHSAPAEHKQLSKSNSNPVIPERPAVVMRMRASLKSTSSMETSPGKSKDFIPTIQTIRASTGDDLSMDDTELFRPTKGRVLDAAKKMEGSFLAPHGQPIRGRRGSSGDINKRRRGSGGEANRVSTSTSHLHMFRRSGDCLIKSC